VEGGRVANNTGGEQESVAPLVRPSISNGSRDLFRDRADLNRERVELNRERADLKEEKRGSIEVTAGIYRC